MLALRTPMFAALLLGLSLGVTSAVHCVAMCGPLSAFVSIDPEGATDPSRVLRYQIGRTGGYAALGGVLGGLGGGIADVFAPWAETILSLVLGSALALAALQLWPRRGAPALVALAGGPRRATLRERLARASTALLGQTRRHPLALGAATALLPCGVLASGALLAASTGHAVTGAVAMTGLALASGLGIGVAGTALGRARVSASPVLARVMAVTLALGAVLLFVRPVLATPEASSCCHPR